jgi:predicted RNase H-like HicB family nuclease
MVIRVIQRGVMKTHSFTAILYKEEDVYIAECPEVGTVDQGETIEQAVTTFQDAYESAISNSSKFPEYISVTNMYKVH